MNEVTLGATGTRAELAIEPGERIRHFVVLGTLGRGGGGLVLAAYDPSLDRKVALKLVRAASADPGDLLREAQALARLSHPNVVTVYEVGTYDDHVFIAMEYVPGATLDAWVAAAPRSPRAIVAAFVAAGRGLEAAHAAGLVHCDVKPRNIMVGDDGGVRVVDFGLALAATSAERSGSSGTPRYMAPEQAEGGPIDARADQYSFCVALHEAVYGVVPADPPDEPRRRAPAWLGRIIARGLAVEPAARFPTMSALLARLSIDRAGRRRRRTLAAVALAAIAAAAVAPGFATDDDACPDPRREVDAVWTPARAAAVAAALAADGDAAPRARAALDAYAGRLVSLRAAACRATYVERTDSEALLEMRRLCLDQRVRAMAAVVGVLAEGTGPATKAMDAIASLPPLDDCTDTAWLFARVTPPADPVSRAEAAEIRGRIDDAYAQFMMDRHADALATARDAHARAAALADEAVLADAEVALGMMLAYNVEPGALEHYAAAVRLGLRSRNYEAAGAAWGHSIYQLGLAGDRGDEAMRVADAGIALLEGIPGGDRRLAGLLGRRGLLHVKEGRYAAGIADLHRARKIRTGNRGADHPETLYTTYYLGTALLDSGDLARAAEVLRGVSDAFRAHVSRLHRIGLLAAKDLALALRLSGRPDEALAVLDEILPDVDEAMRTDRFADRARVLDQRAQALLALGRHDEAVAQARAALTDAVGKLGESAGLAVEYRAGLANALLAAGDVAGARGESERALALAKTGGGLDAPSATEVVWVAAAIAERRGDGRAALAGYERALALAQRRVFGGSGVCELGVAIARVRAALGEPAVAPDPRCAAPAP